MAAAPMPRGVCGKACFGSKAAAERSITNLKRHNRDKRDRLGRLHAYVCKDCRAWHVGHTFFEGDER